MDSTTVFLAGFNRGAAGMPELSARELAIQYPDIAWNDYRVFQNGWIDGNAGDQFRLNLGGVCYKHGEFHMAAWR